MNRWSGCYRQWSVSSCRRREILYNFDDALTHLYFPGRNTVVSFLCRTDERENVEVGLCGNEGVIGADALCIARFSFPNRKC
jgi:hypothetical protein